jgi:hypothetical protein
LTLNGSSPEAGGSGEQAGELAAESIPPPPLPTVRGDVGEVGGPDAASSFNEESDQQVRPVSRS